MTRTRKPAFEASVARAVLMMVKHRRFQVEFERAKRTSLPHWESALVEAEKRRSFVEHLTDEYMLEPIKMRLRAEAVEAAYQLWLGSNEPDNAEPPDAEDDAGEAPEGSKVPEYDPIVGF